METFIRTYLEARGYITTSSLNTYLVTHEYVDIPALNTYLNVNGYIRGKNLESIPAMDLANKLIVVTDDEMDFLKEISFGNLIASTISSDEDNGLTRGIDNKLYVGTPDSGVEAGTYEYPKNLVVDSKGKITSLEQGTVATSSSFGVVKPDNSSITVNNGVISVVLDAIYPVDSVYITTSSSETCPIASLIPGSTWEKVSSGRVLQGADENHSVGTTVAAGLPNITGTWGGAVSAFVSQFGTGAIEHTNVSGGYGLGTGGGGGTGFNFDASRSSSVYGNSTTVQPPAYVVNIWRRTV
jgi:hypothetical protein